MATPGFGQSCIVHGTTGPQITYQYIYLYDSDSKVLVTAPISDHKFSFKVDKTDKPKFLMLYFSTDLMKTHKELMDNPDYEYLKKARRIVALEDTIEVSMTDENQRPVVKGKGLNKDVDDMYMAIKSRKYDVYFEQHSDSPMSMVFLKTLTESASKGFPFLGLSECKSYFHKLSNGLKESDEGKAVWSMINR